MTTLDTTALGYPLPHPDNSPRTVDVPRLRIALAMIDAHVAALHASGETLATVKADKAQVAIDIATAVSQAISDLLDGAPEAYDTLVEIADKLNDNDDVVAGIITTLSTKASAAVVAAALETKADGSILDDAVRVDVEQGFSPAQKAQARKNISAFEATKEAIEVVLGAKVATSNGDVSFGWTTGLTLKVNDTNFGVTWPINVSGMAGGAAYADRLGSGGWTLATVQSQLNARVSDTRVAGFLQQQLITAPASDTPDAMGQSGYFATSFDKREVEIIYVGFRQPQIHIPAVGWRALGSW